MTLCRLVLVASTDDRFTQAVADTLQLEGAVAICIEDLEAADEALEAGLVPDALVLDGACPFARQLVCWSDRQRRRRRLPRLRLVAAAPVDPRDLPSRSTIVGRHDLGAVVDALA